MAMVMKLASLMVMCMVVFAPQAEAISCGQITSLLYPCFPYLRGTAPLQPNCCNGIRSVNSLAKTTPDRQIACKCLQTAARTYKGLNFGLAASLPGKCHVSVPYQISPSTDCSKVK